MYMLKQLNSAIHYIEEHLCAECSPDEAARCACLSTDSFLRFFSYMTGMTLKEYIRRRRLSIAAEDVFHSKQRILDIALKYRYESTASFSRAFAKQHGITPEAYRKHGGIVSIYPPASFHIKIKGAQKMDMRLIELKETVLFGLTKPYENQGYKHPEELRNIMWSAKYEGVPNKICLKEWDEENSEILDGVWFGLWKDGNYTIAREEAFVLGDPLEKHILPAGTYAAFKTGIGGNAWDEFPRLFELIFDSWLPSSPYKQKGNLAIEVLHLWGNREIRRKNRWYEVWIPIEPK